MLLEKVQHRFTRTIPDVKDLKYEDRLDRLGLWTLEERRNRADLIELYKMFHGKSIPLETMFQRNVEKRTRGHTLKLQRNSCSRDVRLHFFAERVVGRWNCLDQEVVGAASVDAFKSRLSKLRKTRMGLFVDNSPIGP